MSLLSNDEIGKIHGKYYTMDIINKYGTSKIEYNDDTIEKVNAGNFIFFYIKMTHA